MQSLNPKSLWVCIKLRIKGNYQKDVYGVYECDKKLAPQPLLWTTIIFRLDPMNNV